VWQGDARSCSDIYCPWFVDSKELKCRFIDGGEKRCTTQIDLEKEVDIDKCLEKYDFISRGEKCAEDCTNKGISVFYVGGNKKLEDIMEASGYKKKGYEGVFPKNIEQKVIAVYDTTECESCRQKFLIREGIGLSEVSIYRFCHYLEKQNIICNNCTKIEKL